jgi:hypothetical protein
MRQILLAALSVNGFDVPEYSLKFPGRWLAPLARILHDRGLATQPLARNPGNALLRLARSGLGLTNGNRESRIGVENAPCASTDTSTRT